jgi:glycosyltransferase involved in cell wall biosynthesis
MIKHIVIDGRIIGTGTGNYLSRMLDQLQKLDQVNNYTIIVTKKGDEFWAPAADNFKKYVFDHDNYEKYGKFSQLDLVKVLNKLKPDLVHFAFQFSPYLYKGRKIVGILDLTQILFENKKSGIGIAYKLKQKMLGHNIRWSAKSAEHVITISNYVAKQLVDIYELPADKITTTYNAADKLFIKSSRSIPELRGKKYICYVGTAFKHKNLTTLIVAFDQLHKTYPELHLALAGKKDVFYETLQQTIKQEKIPNVHILGFVPDEQLVWLYQNAKAYVFPSLSEGFGLPALEAMQYGCPVVSSNATCLPEIYGDAALYFDPNDTSDIANKINQVLADPQLRKCLIKKGHQQVAKYSWQKSAEETLAVYKKVLES